MGGYLGQEPQHLYVYLQAFLYNRQRNMICYLQVLIELLYSKDEDFVRDFFICYITYYYASRDKLNSHC